MDRHNRSRKGYFGGVMMKRSTEEVLSILDELSDADLHDLMERIGERTAASMGKLTDRVNSMLGVPQNDSIDKLQNTNEIMAKEEDGAGTEIKSGFLDHVESLQVDCLQCGNCCRKFRISGGKRVVDLKWKAPTNLQKELWPEDIWTEEGWNREKALLRRILVHTGKDKHGSNWYRCKMLFRNRFTGKWECLIHDSRPSMCRQFVPANATIPERAACRKERRRRIKELDTQQPVLLEQPEPEEE